MQEMDHAGLQEVVAQSATPNSTVGQRFSRPSGKIAVPFTIQKMGLFGDDLQQNKDAYSTHGLVIHYPYSVSLAKEDCDRSMQLGRSYLPRD